METHYVCRNHKKGKIILQFGRILFIVLLQPIQFYIKISLIEYEICSGNIMYAEIIKGG